MAAFLLHQYNRYWISITTGFVKKLLKTTRNKKKKHNKIIMLVRSKLISIESKMYEALINNEISHENFMIIFNEQKKISRIKAFE